MGKAGTTEQKITLARTSIQRAKTLNEDLPGSFALLQLARELAIESGDTALALEVIAAVEERFHVEGPVLKAGALAGLCRWNNPPLKNLPKDNAVIVAVRSFDAKGGVYRLETLADDGIRVWIDGRPVLENWSNHMIRQNTAQFPLRAGEHTMRVEYYEAGALSRLGVWLRRVQ